ncbi:MAG: hypothetical protein ACPHV3_07935 [Vibrio sp.]
MKINHPKSLFTRALPVGMTCLLLAACASNQQAASSDPLAGEFLQIPPPNVTMTQAQKDARTTTRIVPLVNAEDKIQKVGDNVVDPAIAQWSLQDGQGQEQLKLIELPAAGYDQMFGADRQFDITCGGSPKFIFCATAPGTKLNDIPLQTGYFGVVLNQGVVEFEKK